MNQINISLFQYIQLTCRPAATLTWPHTRYKTLLPDRTPGASWRCPRGKPGKSRIPRYRYARVRTQYFVRLLPCADRKPAPSPGPARHPYATIGQPATDRARRSPQTPCRSARQHRAHREASAAATALPLRMASASSYAAASARVSKNRSRSDLRV